ncbi:MAG: glycosyltransferase family 4 protein [Melioribacteraceae bacterium]|nr:glycosyltransferase family 4 protein [Melioribacteraceae bacterium]
MKVLINTPDMTKLGGVSNINRILSKYLDKDSVSFFVVGNRTGEKKGFPRLLKDYSEFVKTIKKGKIDIVHLNPSLDPKCIIRDSVFLILSKLYKRKVLVFFHGWQEDTEQKLKKYFHFLFKRAIKSVDLIIVLSDKVKKKLTEYTDSKKILIKNTVVEDEFNEKAEELLNSTTRKNNQILFLSRVEKAKGIYEAIDAFIILINEIEDLSFIVAGDGTELENVKEYVLKKGIKNISFPGFVKGQKKIDYYISSSLYIFPSYAEGMPTTVLEAMICGLPIVTTNVGGLTDFFANGKMGFITDDKNPQNLAGLVKKILIENNLRSEISIYNREYSKKNFLGSKLAADLIECYEAILKK